MAKLHKGDNKKSLLGRAIGAAGIAGLTTVAGGLGALLSADSKKKKQVILKNIQENIANEKQAYNDKIANRMGTGFDRFAANNNSMVAMSESLQNIQNSIQKRGTHTAQALLEQNFRMLGEITKGKGGGAAPQTINVYQVAQPVRHALRPLLYKGMADELMELMPDQAGAAAKLTEKSQQLNSLIKTAGEEVGLNESELNRLTSSVDKILQSHGQGYNEYLSSMEQAAATGNKGPGSPTEFKVTAAERTTRTIANSIEKNMRTINIVDEANNQLMGADGKPLTDIDDIIKHTYDEDYRRLGVQKAAGTVSDEEYIQRTIGLNERVNTLRDKKGQIRDFVKRVKAGLRGEEPIPASRMENATAIRSAMKQETWTKSKLAEFDTTSDAYLDILNNETNDTFKNKMNFKIHRKVRERILRHVNLAAKDLPVDMKNAMLESHGGNVKTMTELIDIYKKLGIRDIDNVESGVLDVLKNYTQKAKDLGYKGKIRFDIGSAHGQVQLRIGMNNEIAETVFDLSAGGRASVGNTEYYSPMWVKKIQETHGGGYQLFSPTSYQTELIKNRSSSVIESMLNPSPDAGEWAPHPLTQLARVTRQMRQGYVRIDSIRPEMSALVRNADFLDTFEKPQRNIEMYESKLKMLNDAKRTLEHKQSFLPIDQNYEQGSSYMKKITQIDEEISGITTSLKGLNANQPIGIGKRANAISKKLIDDFHSGNIEVIANNAVFADGTMPVDLYSLSRQQVANGNIVGLHDADILTGLSADRVGKHGMPVFEAADDVIGYSHHRTANTFTNEELVKTLMKDKRAAATNANVFHVLDKHNPLFQSTEQGEIYMRNSVLHRMAAKNQTKYINIGTGDIVYSQEFLKALRAQTDGAEGAKSGLTKDTATQVTKKFWNKNTIVGHSNDLNRTPLKISDILKGEFRDSEQIQLKLVTRGGVETIKADGVMRMDAFNKTTGKLGVAGLGQQQFDESLWDEILSRNNSLLDKKIQPMLDATAAMDKVKIGGSMGFALNLEGIMADKKVGKGYYDYALRTMVGKAADDAKKMLLRAAKERPDEFLENGILKLKYVKEIQNSINNVSNTLLGSDGVKYFEAVTDSRVTGQYGLSDNYLSQQTGFSFRFAGKDSTTAEMFAAKSHGAFIDDAAWWNETISSVDGKPATRLHALTKSLDNITRTIKDSGISEAERWTPLYDSDVKYKIQKLEQMKDSFIKANPDMTESQLTKALDGIEHKFAMNNAAYGLISGRLDENGKLTNILGYLGNKEMLHGAQRPRLAAKVSKYRRLSQVAAGGAHDDVQIDMWKRLAMKQKGMSAMDDFVGEYIGIGQQVAQEQMKAINPYFSADETISATGGYFKNLDKVSYKEVAKGLSGKSYSTQKLHGDFRVAVPTSSRYSGIDLHLKFGADGKLSAEVAEDLAKLNVDGMNLSKMTSSNLMTIDEYNHLKKFMGKVLTLDNETAQTASVIEGAGPKKVLATYLPKIDRKSINDPLVITGKALSTDAAGNVVELAKDQQFVVVNDQMKAFSQFMKTIQDKDYLKTPQEITNNIVRQAEAFGKLTRSPFETIFGGKQSLFGQALHKTRVPGYVGVGKSAGIELSKYSKDGKNAFRGMLNFGQKRGSQLLTPKAGENWVSKSHYIQHMKSKFIMTMGGKPDPIKAEKMAQRMARDIISGKKTVYGAGWRESTMFSGNFEGMRLRLYDDDLLDMTKMGGTTPDAFAHGHIRNILSFASQGGDTDSDLYYFLQSQNDAMNQESGRASYRSLRVRTIGKSGKIDYTMSGNVVRFMGKVPGVKGSTIESLKDTMLFSNARTMIETDSSVALQAKYAGGQVITDQDSYAFKLFGKALKVHSAELQGLDEQGLNNAVKRILIDSGGEDANFNKLYSDFRWGKIGEDEYLTEVNKFAKKNNLSPGTAKRLVRVSKSLKTKMLAHAEEHFDFEDEVDRRNATRSPGTKKITVSDVRSELKKDGKLLETIRNARGLYVSSHDASAIAAKAGQASVGGSVYSFMDFMDDNIENEVSGLFKDKGNEIVKVLADKGKKLTQQEAQQLITNTRRTMMANYVNEKIATPGAWKESRELWQAAMGVYGEGGSKENKRVFNAIDFMHYKVQQGSMSSKHALPLIFDGWRTTMGSIQGRSNGNFYGMNSQQVTDTIGQVRNILKNSNSFAAGRQVIMESGDNKLIDAYSMMSGDHYMDQRILNKPAGYHEDIKRWQSQGLWKHKLSEDRDYIFDRLNYLKLKAKEVHRQRGAIGVKEGKFLQQYELMLETMDTSRGRYHGRDTISAISEGFSSDLDEMGKIDAYHAQTMEGMAYSKSVTNKRNVAIMESVANVRRDFGIIGGSTAASTYYDMSHSMGGLMNAQGELKIAKLATIGSTTGALGTGQQLMIDTFGQSAKGMFSTASETAVQQIRNQQNTFIDDIMRMTPISTVGAPNVLEQMSRRIASKATSTVNGSRLGARLMGAVENKANQSKSNGGGIGFGIGAGLGIALGSYLVAQAFRSNPAPELGNAPGRGGEYWEHHKRKKDEASFNPTKYTMNKATAVMNRIMATNTNSKNAYVSFNGTQSQYGGQQSILHRNQQMGEISRPELSGYGYGSGSTYSRALALTR